VLQYGHPIDFIHPIVRQAVYSEIPPGERSLGHSRAARVLSDSGSTPDLVAAQLLATDPGGDAWVVDTLRRAAEEIFARGSPTAAADYLARALDEPPPVPERGPLLKRLGAVELVAARPHEAIGHLREALDHLTDPRAHAEALQELGRALGTTGQVQEAIQMYERASIEAQAVDAALGAEFEAQFLCLATMLPTEAPRAAGRLKQIDRLEGTTAAECSLLAVLALGAVKENRPPSVVSEFADRALRNGLLGEDIATHVIAHAQAVWSLVFAESIDLAERACIHALDVARRRGATVNFASGSAWLSVTTLRAGEVWRAEAHGRDAYATATTYDLAWLIPISVAVLIDALLERGQLDEAEAILDRSGLQGEAIGYTSFTSPFLSRGRLRIGQRRLREGLEDCLECGRREQVLVGANTARHAWRSAAALAHLALGEVEEARTLAERELALAREFGAPRQLGIALRAAGLVEGGERALQLLQESADALEESPASLELARTLTDLGAALRRAKRRADSRDPLRRALELAHECGATTLEDRARQELLATGARPRRVQLSGVASLTASERRVAEMAAGGMTNKEIAQAQFVSARTVETHLAHVYRKLGISSRGALGPALAQESPEAIAGP
jgi:DNA-binding CsgD family transcriptional regulator